MSTDPKSKWYSNVGLRKLPYCKLEYYARPPIRDASSKKNDIFKTIYLPTNASDRVIKDKQQDLLYIKFAMANKGKLRVPVKKDFCTLTKGFEKGHYNTAHEKITTKKLPLVTKSLNKIPVCYELATAPLPKIAVEFKPQVEPHHVKIATWKAGRNSLAPANALGKPTCGYFFNRDIDHKKRLIGINATNTVKWRTISDTVNIRKV